MSKSADQVNDRVQRLTQQMAAIRAELTELTGAPTLGFASPFCEQTLDALLQALADPVLVVSASRSVIKANSAAVDFCGFDPSATDAGGHPTSLAQLAERLAVRYADGRPVPVEKLPTTRALNGETVVHESQRFRDAAGRERVISTSASPLWHGSELQGVVIIWHDQTERESLLAQVKTQAAELSQREAALEAVIASLPDAVYAGNENGIFRCNQRALDNLGCQSIEELQAMIPVLNEKLQNRYAGTGERIKPEDEAFARALRGQPWAYEVISRNLETGQDIIQRCAANPIVLDGQVIGAVAINTDITEQVHLRQMLQDTVAELSKREAALAELTASLQSTHGELERRVQERTAQLEAEIAQRHEITQQLRALARRLVQVQEEERRSLAQATHDTAGQALTALKMGLAVLQREGNCAEGMQSRIEDLRRIAETVAEDLHRLSVSLRPSSLDRYGLVPALEQLLATFRKQTGIEIGFLVQGMEERLPGDMETAIYRIVQEATTNIARYAGAAMASVLVQREGDTVRVIIEDNGPGFDAEEALRRGRLGLLGMRERAEMLGGTCTIETSPGSGATLYVELPVSGTGAESAFSAGPERSLPSADSDPRRVSPVEAAVLGEAAELARAKVLSDALVEISAGMTGQESAEELLDFVLARSAEAIGCDYAFIQMRDAGYWVFSYGYRLDESMLGLRLADEDAPVATKVEQTREVVILNDMEVEGPLAAPARKWGARSGAAIPLVADGKLLGMAAYIHTISAVPFYASEVSFLKRLSHLVSLALENIHLHEVETQQRADLTRRVEELQALLDVLPVGIGIAYDRECKDIKTNPAFAQMLGIRPQANASLSADEPEKPTTFKVLLDGRELAPEELPMQVAAAQGVAVRDLIVDVRRDDGATLTLLEHAVPLIDASGHPRGSVGAFVDITELRRAQAEAEEGRRTLEALLEYIPEGIVIADAPDLTIRHLSRYGQTYLGGPHEGHSGQEMIAGWVAYQADGATAVAEEDLPLVRAVRCGEIVRNQEFVWVNAQGQRFPLLVSAGPLRDRQGRITGGVYAWHDIAALKEVQNELAQRETALRQALQAVRQSEAIYRAIAQNLPNSGVYVFDTDLRFLVVAGEAQTFLGHDPQAMEGKTIWEALDAETVQRVEPPYRRALAGEALHREVTYRGRQFIVDYRPIVEEGGQVVAGLALGVDISERAAAERERERLREDNLRQGRLTADLVAALPLGVCLLGGPDLRYELVNPMFEQLVRLPADQLLGRTAGEVFPVTQEAVSGHLERVYATGETVRLHEQLFNLGPGRAETYWDGAYVPMRGDAGAVEGVLAVVIEVTEAVLARRRAEASEITLDALLDHIPVGIAIVNAADMTVHHNSRYAHEVLAASDVGDTFEDLEARWTAYEPDSETPIALDDRPLVRALRYGESVQAREMVQVDPTGRRLATLASAGPIRDHEGRITAAIIAWQDLGALKEAERARDRERDLLHAILNSIADEVWYSDAEGNFYLANLAALRGFGFDKPGETFVPVPEWHDLEIYNPDGTLRPHEDAPLLRALRGETILSGEEIGRRLDTGELRHRQYSAAPIRDAAGHIAGSVAAVRDVTPLHEAMREAQTQAVAAKAAAESLEQRVLERTAELTQREASLQAAIAQIKSLSRRLVQMQEHERGYVADRLFNQVNQVLAALNMQLGLLQKQQHAQASVAQLTEMKAILDQAISDLHDLATRLRPVGLDRSGLANVLRGQLAEFGRTHEIAVHFSADEIEDLRLPPDVVTAVYRTMEEALANIANHAQATTVTLVVGRIDDDLTISLEDNGVGFDVPSAGQGGGVGLIAMRERIESIDAQLSIESGIRGTHVFIEVPLEHGG